MMKADTRTLRMRLRVMMLSFTLRGGFLITSLSTGSTPKLEPAHTGNTFRIRVRKESSALHFP